MPGLETKLPGDSRGSFDPISERKTPKSPTLLSIYRERKKAERMEGKMCPGGRHGVLKEGSMDDHLHA